MLIGYTKVSFPDETCRSQLVEARVAVLAAQADLTRWAYVHGAACSVLRAVGDLNYDNPGEVEWRLHYDTKFGTAALTALALTQEDINLAAALEFWWFSRRDFVLRSNNKMVCTDLRPLLASCPVGKQIWSCIQDEIAMRNLAGDALTY